MRARNEILKKFKKVQGESLGNMSKAVEVGAIISSKLELVEGKQKNKLKFFWSLFEMAN